VAYLITNSRMSRSDDLLVTAVRPKAKYIFARLPIHYKVA